VARTAVVIIAPIFERQTARIYRNSARHRPDGTLLGVIMKMHPDDVVQQMPPPSDEQLDHERAGEAKLGLEDPLRNARRLDLLGPMVSGSRADHGPPGRSGVVLSDRHRVAPERER
jgi:hypothetical protein